LPLAGLCAHLSAVATVASPQELALALASLRRLTLAAVLSVAALAAHSAFAAGAAPEPDRTVDMATVLKPGSLAELTMGDASGIPVVEYGSLTCPHCAAFDQSLFPRLKAEYIDSGKIRYVFRDFPRDRLDLQAFQLAHCEHGRVFWPLIELLYQNQLSWTKVHDARAQLLQFARQAGLAEPAARACLADQSLANASAVSLQAGSKAGVEFTPTFFVNGQKIALWSYEDWQKALKEAGAE
jgi:protein-disulfide isomerase